MGRMQHTQLESYMKMVMKEAKQEQMSMQSYLSAEATVLL